MKKVLIIIAVLFAVAAIGLALFILTFDVNRYKDALAAQLETVVGNPVEIGKLTLAWKGKIELGVDGFAILVDEDGRKVRALSCERASASLELAPILRGQFQISAVSLIKPSIHIIRTKQGAFRLRGYDPKPAAPKADAAGSAPAAREGRPAAASAASKGAPALAFNVADFEIRDGVMRFQDFAQQPAADITIQDVDASIRDISLTAPVRFDVKMAVAGTTQNLAFSGVAGGFVVGPSYLKDFDLTADLGALEHARLLQALPALRAAGVKEGMRGVIKAKVRDLVISDEKLSKVSADLDFSGGRLAMSGLRVPVENVDLSASMEGSTLTIKNFSGRLANATLQADGKVTDFFTAPRSNVNMNARVPGIRSFLSSVLGGNQRVDGNLTLSFKGTASGSDWPTVSRTLAGSGTLTLDNGIIVNTNVAAQSLGGLTLFPNVLEGVNANVPNDVRQSLARNETVINPIRQQFTISGGYIMMPGLALSNDVIDFRGEAKISFMGDLSGSGMLRFAAAVSNAIITAVPPMQYLADASGLIGFPVTFKAGDTGIKVNPDMKYIGQRAAVATGQEIVGQLMKKAMGKEAASGSAAGAAQSGSGESIDKFMESMKALQKELKGK